MTEGTTLSGEENDIEETLISSDGKGEQDETEVGLVESDDSEELTLVEQLALAEAKAAEYLDGWQRARAEFSNARKRLEKQRSEAYQNAAVDHAAKLLPILDDFDRALVNVPSEIADNSWFQGIELVRRKFQSIMEGLQVEPIEAVGQPFDPNFHEALSLKEADGVESGTVIEELLVGYRLGDRVIRPSLVNVAA
jgi:molecular chaperone GrpE